MTEDTTLLNYCQLLKLLEKNSSPNHLLLGNGFNSSLGIFTGYDNIFQQMKQNYPQYAGVEERLKKCDYDIEQLIKTLKDGLRADAQEKEFLSNFIENKVKFDFMTAAYEIVRPEIANIYKEKNNNVHILLKNFKNYFTLNYDPLLYLLLMKFKKNQKSNFLTGIAFLEDGSVKDALDEQERKIYDELKRARKSGFHRVFVPGDSDMGPLNRVSIADEDLSVTTKQDFQHAAEMHLKKNRISATGKQLKKIINLILQEENSSVYGRLPVDDGFAQNGSKFYFDNSIDLFGIKRNAQQNLFFLHGAFHIIHKNRKTEKITQQQTKAFRKRLEEIIGSQSGSVICVLTGTSDDKKDQIDGSKYLSECFGKLKELNGNLVILGSSLSENDKHIFDSIKDSNISVVYVGTRKKNFEKTANNARDLFEGKTIRYFNYKTISYTPETD